MKKYLFILFVLPLMWVGCEEPEITDRKPVIRTEEVTHNNNHVKCSFWLTTQGDSINAATVFKKGEVFTMHYAIENIGDSAICCIVEDCSNPAFDWFTYMDGWGKVYRSDDNAEMPAMGWTQILGFGTQCYGIYGGPLNPTERLYNKITYTHPLEKGNYYVLLKTAVVFRNQCSLKYPDQPSNWDDLTTLEKSFRIDFEVK